MKLLLISLFLIWVWSCKNVVNNNTEKDPLNESLSIESDTKINNPLIGKKFYYLYKFEGELVLAVHPYLKGDDDMPTIVFINDMLIDNWNTMEGNEWTIEKIEEKDTLLTYFVKMEDGDSSDTLCLSYNAKKGLMYNIRKDTTFILIDSLYINKIKKIATKIEFSDD